MLWHHANIPFLLKLFPTDFSNYWWILSAKIITVVLIYWWFCISLILSTFNKQKWTCPFDGTSIVLQKAFMTQTKQDSKSLNKNSKGLPQFLSFWFLDFYSNPAAPHWEKCDDKWNVPTLHLASLRHRTLLSLY